MDRGADSGVMRDSRGGHMVGGGRVRGAADGHGDRVVVLVETHAVAVFSHFDTRVASTRLINVDANDNFI